MPEKIHVLLNPWLVIGNRTTVALQESVDCQVCDRCKLKDVLQNQRQLRAADPLQ